MLAPVWAGAGGPGSVAGPVAVPPPSEEALRFYRSGNWLWLLGRVLALTIPLLALSSGLLVRLQEALEEWTGGRGWLVVPGVFLAYLLVAWLLKLPFRFYVGYLRLHAYGLSNQSLARWGVVALERLGVGLGLSLVVLGVVWGLMRWSPRRWWLAASALAVPWSFFLLFAEPLWIAPLFHDFGPMQDPALEARILGLAERAGIEGSRVFEVAMKVDTSRVNAYVTGFGGSHRIVLWDTLLEELEEDEVLWVMGHEMGHYALDHVPIGMLLANAGVLLLFLGIHLLGREALGRWGEGWGLARLDQPAALPLVIVLGLGLSWLGEPVGLWLSRHMEREADRFALELTRDNQAGARAFVRLQVTNLGNPWPGPLFVALRSTHPPAGERIHFCNRYRPWETGASLAYGDRFRPSGEEPAP